MDIIILLFFIVVFLLQNKKQSTLGIIGTEKNLMYLYILLTIIILILGLIVNWTCFCEIWLNIVFLNNFVMWPLSCIQILMLLWLLQITNVYMTLPLKVQCKR